jgi:hypothetical protein
MSYYGPDGSIPWTIFAGYAGALCCWVLALFAPEITETGDRLCIGTVGLIAALFSTWLWRRCHRDSGN